MKKIYFTILILLLAFIDTKGQRNLNDFNVASGDAPSLHFEPFYLDFGNGLAGTTKTLRLDVYPDAYSCWNVLEQATNILSIDILNRPNDDYFCANKSDWIYLEVTVTYPQTLGNFNTWLNFEWDVDDFPWFQVPIIGNVISEPDNSPPTAPTNLRLVTQTLTTCNFAWNASTDNVEVEGYKIFKNGTLLATLTSTTLNYTASITNAVSSFKVKAFDAAGNVSTASNTIYVDGIPPSTPVANAATSVNSTSFVMNWTPSSGATGYVFDLSTSSDFSTFVNYFYYYNNISTSIFTGDPNSSVVLYVGITSGTTYYYRLRATKGTVQSANSNVVTVLTAPARPTAKAATNVSPTSFTANWNSVSGNVSGYRLDVSTSSSFTSFVSGYQNLSVSGTNRLVTGLSSSNTYYYRVRAINSGGSSYNSNIIETAYILPPVANAATSVNSTSFVMNWTPSSGATGYVVDISTLSDFSTFVYTYNNASTTSFTGDPNSSVVVYGMIYPGTTYYYRLRAVKGTAQSANSNVISVTTMAAGIIPPPKSVASAPMEESLNISDTKVIIYPNPVNDRLNIKLEDFEERVNLNIFNSSGILIKSLVISGPINYIDVSSFPKGMYLINVNGKVASKFIKE
ncbi:MAG: fibronectin type III domain-containing protein [Bacteroidales bacterium]|jgi:hypothetical protein|nr:fibronectin type III domain-containing protein [Bacteroidales bacterium]